MGAAKALPGPELFGLAGFEQGRQAARLMSKQQVRRLPVVEEGRLVGMLSLADLARSHRYDMEAAQALSEISENILWSRE